MVEYMDQVQMIPAYKMSDIDQKIIDLYAKSKVAKQNIIADRLAAFSQLLMGRPYENNPCGEGPQGVYDQKPLYRIDVFDCVTFVNCVLALALSGDLISFQNTLKAIAYADGVPDYLHRNHFTSSEWNVFNNNKGILKDVTKAIVSSKGNPLFKLAKTTIDKSGWLQKRGIQDLFLQSDEQTAVDKKALLARLHQHAHDFQPTMIETAYLPLKDLFDAHQKPHTAIFAQIPVGSVIEIIRPNWDLKAKIGTNLNVSHMGFVLKNQAGELVFRHASTVTKCVTDVSLVQYLLERLESPTIKGINIQAACQETFR